MDMGQGASMALPIWGIFLKRIYNDTTYAKWREEKFPELPKKLTTKFYCSNYIGEIESDSLDMEEEELLPEDELLETPPPPSGGAPNGGNDNDDNQQQ
jgi:penicillin-binding protein 1A